MTLSMLAVRIPEEIHTYLKHKALVKKMTMQDLVCEIITQHLKQDVEYIPAFELLVEIANTQNKKEAQHDT